MYMYVERGMSILLVMGYEILRVKMFICLGISTRVYVFVCSRRKKEKSKIGTNRSRGLVRESVFIVGFEVALSHFVRVLSDCMCLPPRRT